MDPRLIFSLGCLGLAAFITFDGIRGELRAEVRRREREAYERGRRDARLSRW